MTTLMNQKLARAYIKTLQDKLIKKVKLITKKLTSQDLIEMIIQLLPYKSITNFQIHQHSQTNLHMLQIIQRNQTMIVDNRCQIDYLRRKIQLEDQLMASFIKNIVKDRNIYSLENITKNGLKRQKSNSLLNLPNMPSLSRFDTSRVDFQQSRLNESSFDKSPIVTLQRNQYWQVNRYGTCNTSRSKFSPINYQISQSQPYTQPEQKQKKKALAKLLKLQRYVFQKQNIHKDKSIKKIYNCGISPTKMRYKQQNENLKVIQSNLVTHLSLMEKYREIPSIEGLVARQQALKKREKHLKELGQILDKKQLSLNIKHTEFLKKQKSQRVI